jgi:hypothetical protein
MTKMSKAQRAAILAAENQIKYTPGGAAKRFGMVVAGARTEHVLRREGWVFGPFDQVTRAGLIAAGVDMDAIHAEALEMSGPWTNRLSAEGRQVIRDATHAEALREHARRAPAHIRTDCPALAIDGCMQCTAPATVRAAHGDDSAYTCGRPWVAEIQRCPRCGQDAAAHVGS